MHNFRELKIWQSAIEICTNIYSVTAKLPKDEVFGLSSQMKRCSVSIAANIAEGAGRNSNKEFLHFLGIANGSAYELQTHIVIAERVGLFINDNTKNILQMLDEFQKMNWAFQKNIANKLPQKSNL